MDDDNANKNPWYKKTDGELIILYYYYLVYLNIKKIEHANNEDWRKNKPILVQNCFEELQKFWEKNKNQEIKPHSRKQVSEFFTNSLKGPVPTKYLDILERKGVYSKTAGQQTDSPKKVNNPMLNSLPPQPPTPPQSPTLILPQPQLTINPNNQLFTSPKKEDKKTQTEQAPKYLPIKLTKQTQTKFKEPFILPRNDSSIIQSAFSEFRSNSLGSDFFDRNSSFSFQFQNSDGNDKNPLNSSSAKILSKPRKINFTSSSDMNESITRDILYNTLPKNVSNFDFNSDKVKDVIYSKLKKCYLALKKSKEMFKSNENQNGTITKDNHKLNFEKEVEKKFLKLIKIFTENINKEIVNVNDIYCETIMNTPLVKTSGSFSNEGSIQNFVVNENSELRNPIKVPSIFEYELYTKMSSLRPFNLNEKLLSLFTFDFDEENFFSYEFENIELSTLITFNLDLSEVNNAMNEFMFNYPAFVYYSPTKNSFILQIKDVQIDTEIHELVNSILFDRCDNENRIYIGCQHCVKEFTVFGLDDYIRNTFRENMHPVHFNQELDPDHSQERETVRIECTNTFNFDSNEPIKKGAISIWEDEIVFGFNNSLLFWPFESKKLEKIEIENMSKISCLRTFSEQDSKSYLAVGSSKYPVIYIYNKEHQNIRRLISHTMGVTSLSNFGLSLFSGSKDRTVRMWEVNDGIELAQITTQTQKITAIGIGTFYDQIFLFSCGIDATIDCWSINCKKLLFRVKLNENVVPKEIIFNCFYSFQKGGDVARLVVLSKSERIKGVKFQVFEFI